MATTQIALPKTKHELEFNQGSVYEEEDKEAVLRVLEASAPSCGNEVLSFEREFAEFVGTQYGIAVGNATQGLEIAVRAALASATAAVRGDEGGQVEVVVPSISWISTACSAALAGAKVIFADVVDPTCCIDPESVKRLVTPRTAAVIVVHLFGRPVDGVVELASWLRERGIVLIEDCAHAVGAVVLESSSSSSSINCGCIGDIGVFSFHQQKNMVWSTSSYFCLAPQPFVNTHKYTQTHTHKHKGDTRRRGYGDNKQRNSATAHDRLSFSLRSIL